MSYDIRAHVINGPAGTLNVHTRSGTPPRRPSPTVVLLHGIQGTAAAWAPVAQKLPRANDVVMPNLRGRAGSVSPTEEGAYAMERFADDLAAVLETVDSSVVLAGWSMGVLVALAYIRDYGLARIRALALIGGTARPGSECLWFRGSDGPAIAAEAEARAAALGLTEAAEPHAVAGSWLSARRADLANVLATIHVPTTILHGADDDQCPVSQARLLAGHVPQARLVIKPAAGHHLPVEAPDFLAEHIGALVGSARR